MPRHSSIKKLPKEIKAAIDGLLKEGRFTLDQIRSEVLGRYGDEAVPSRSALGRYKKNFDDLAKELRETREIADVWAQKLGSVPDSDIGKVVLEILRTLSYRVGADLMQSGDLDAKAIAQLARAMNYIEDAGRLGLARELELRRSALDAAANAATEVAKKKGVSKETVDLIRREILGISDDKPAKPSA